MTRPTLEVLIEVYPFLAETFSVRRGWLLNAFTTGNPFFLTKFLGVRIGRGFRAVKGLVLRYGLEKPGMMLI